MVSLLFRKSLVDFWDNFVLSALWNILTLGLFALGATSVSWAGPFWPVVLTGALGLWQAGNLGIILRIHFQTKIPGARLASLSLLWAAGLLLGCFGIAFYLSSGDPVFWFIGLSLFWILLLILTLFSLLAPLLLFGLGRGGFLTACLERIFQRPSILLSTGPVLILGFLSQVILFPGSSWAVHWTGRLSTALGRLVKDPALTWDQVEKEGKAELQGRSLVSLIFPWRNS